MVVYRVACVKVTLVDAEMVPMVAVMVSVCANVEVSVAVNTPETVLPLVDENVLLVPEAVKLTAWPDIELPLASSTVTVSVVVVVPSAASDVGLAVTADFALLGTPSVKVTEAVFDKPAKLAVTVFVWATVLFKVTENTPDALVDPVVALNVLLVPLALNVTA
jgi:hypothetical protein